MLKAEHEAGYCTARSEPRRVKRIHILPEAIDEIIRASSGKSISVRVESKLPDDAQFVGVSHDIHTGRLYFHYESEEFPYQQIGCVPHDEDSFYVRFFYREVEESDETTAEDLVASYIQALHDRIEAEYGRSVAAEEDTSEVDEESVEIPYEGKIELRIDDDETRFALDALMSGDKRPLPVVLERLPPEARKLLPKDMGEWAANNHFVELRGITLEYRIV